MPEADYKDVPIESTSGLNTGPGVSAKPLSCPKCGLALSDGIFICPQDGTSMLPAVEGTELGARYEFIEPIARGGMSIIYKARHRAINKLVAIKMLLGGNLDNNSILRLQREAKAVGALDHPNIVKVLDCGVSEFGQPYLVMDYVEGKTLAQIIKDVGPMSVMQSMLVFSELCSALAHAHEHGILHRDLKPSNVMLTTSSISASTVRVVDFGIAKMTGTESGGTADVTRTGEIFGSPLYMSPEQCSGGDIDHRSDIYSLGCLMYECLTGDPPLQGKSVLETLTKQLNEKPEPIDKRFPHRHFPNSLIALVDRCLEKTPEKRYTNMHEVLSVIHVVESEIDGETSSRTTPGLPMPAIIAGAACVLAVSAVSLLHRFCSSPPAQPAVQKSTAPITPRQAATTPPPPAPPPTAKLLVHDDETLLLALKTHPEIAALDLTRTRVDNRGVELLPQFTHLSDLALAHTSITDESCASIAKIPALRRLNLAADRISNKGIGFLSNLGGLKYLNLDSTDVNDGSLPYISKLTNLEQLSVSRTEINYRNLISSIKDLPITHLDMVDIEVDNGDLTGLQALKHLVHVHLVSDSVNDRSVQDLCAIPSLVEIEINSHSVTDRCTKYFANLPKLKHLRLEYSDIDDVGAAEFAKLKNVSLINLSYSRVSDGCIKSLSAMPSLLSICFDGCEITDVGVEQLTHMPNLRTLWMHGTQISDSSIDKLVSMKSLKNLSVGGTKITPEGYRRLRSLFQGDWLKK